MVAASRLRGRTVAPAAALVSLGCMAWGLMGLGTATLHSQQTPVPQRWLTAWSTSQHVLGAAGTSRPVLFSGSATVTIPAGASVESDQLALKVSARQDLAVSLFLPEVHEPSNADRMVPAFNCDDIHPSPLGYYEMAKAVRLSLFR